MNSLRIRINSYNSYNLYSHRVFCKMNNSKPVSKICGNLNEWGSCQVETAVMTLVTHKECNDGCYS